MFVIMRTLVCISILFMVMACGRHEDPINRIDIERYIHEGDIGTQDMSSYFDAEVFKIEDRDDCLIAAMHLKDVIGDTLVFKINGHKLCYINAVDGSILHVFNRYGRGPQEYLDMTGVSLDKKGNNVYVVDYKKGKILCYDKMGDFVEEVGFEGISAKDVSDLKCLDDGSFAICFSPQRKGHSAVGIYSAGRRKMRDSKMLKSSFKTYMTHINQFHNLSGICVFKDNFSDTLSYISSECDHPFMIVDRGKLRMPDEYYSNRKLYNDNEYLFIQSYNYIIADELLFLEFFYKDKLYRDVYEIKSGRLISRTLITQEFDGFGFPVKIGDQLVNCWPKFVARNEIYCTIPADQVARIYKQSDDFGNPVLIKLTRKDIRPKHY